MPAGWVGSVIEREVPLWTQLPAVSGTPLSVMLTTLSTNFPGITIGALVPAITAEVLVVTLES